MLFALLEEAISSLSIRSSTKAFHKLCLGQLCQPQRSYIGHQIFGQVISREEKSQNLVINRVKGLGSGPHTPPKFSGSTPRAEIIIFVNS